jgi:hypothetical protein
MNPNVSNYLVRTGLVLVAAGVVLAVLVPLLYSDSLRYPAPGSRPGDAVQELGDGLKTDRREVPPAIERRPSNAAKEALAEQTARVRDLERALVKMSGGPDQEQRQRELIVELNALANMVVAELHAKEIELVELKSEMVRASVAQVRDDPGINAMGSRQGIPVATARNDLSSEVSWFERAGQLGSFFSGISGMKIAWVIFAGGGLTGIGYLMQGVAWLRRKRGGAFPAAAS